MLQELSALPALPTWQAALALAPALVTGAAAALAWLAPGAAAEPDGAAGWRTAQRAAGLALVAALANLAVTLAAGAAAGPLLRADAVGGTVLLLVAFVAAVIVRYSASCLAGAPGAPRFVRWLMATLSAVALVTVANHLLLLAIAWMGASMALHRLLTFFAERRAAQVAAHKKFLLSRLADACMLVATALTWSSLGTAQIDQLLAAAAAQPSLPVGAMAAAVLIAVAALLKCAVLPFHGWLIQVMEAPTPVSALLHAGVVNLGGFVLIRLAPLVAEVPLAHWLLVLGGTFTAVVAALVMTTRISVKVALAWSTCAQMGFMLLQCGLGLWEMALFHLVAHSLYKAHAFLASGGVVRRHAIAAMAPSPAPASLGNAAAGVLLALAALAAAAQAWGVADHLSPALCVLGAVFALSLAPLLQPGSLAAAGAHRARQLVVVGLLAFGYVGIHALLAGRVAPPSAVPTGVAWLVPAIAFAGLFTLQTLIALHPGAPLVRGLYPWLYGGLFLDERFSRWLFRIVPPANAAAPGARASTPAVRPTPFPSSPAGDRP